ncbi:SRPBCC domain-containing protein [Gemmatimonas sp.]|uniref:SRPBCC domain-containing protein n=1 Tax=Gemmatimonas sp. TaxID=1962908 RepID=UPI0039836A3D
MYDLTIARTSPLPATALYRAWTTGWGTWFAEPDSARVRAAVGEPFFFAVAQRFDDGRDLIRHPHYGRFLRLEPTALVSLNWVTGVGGTEGAETVLTVHLDAIAGDFTQVSLTHEGFVTRESRDAHEKAWPLILAHQDAALQALGSVEPSASALSSNRSLPDATFIPVRSYPDVDAAVTWLRAVLGARERLRVADDTGPHRVQLTVGNGAVVVAAWDAAATPATGGRPPAVLMVRVPDVNAAYERALALGFTGLTPPADFPFGERQASVRDPAGHAWTLTQTIADVDPATWGGELVD